eukprot:TRINITY_DN1214_c0_g1_i1.p1 TRINITY_DN1214_c0_g1~~TRINITY_DN1214_c0_g1_i1.p1  ORF type:complete len:168 (+),score=28.19 TRINITY_DN1214_c0_g1_i1:72-575(+)
MKKSVADSVVGASLRLEDTPQACLVLLAQRHAGGFLLCVPDKVVPSHVHGFVCGEQELVVRVVDVDSTGTPPLEQHLGVHRAGVQAVDQVRGQLHSELAGEHADTRLAELVGSVGCVAVLELQVVPVDLVRLRDAADVDDALLRAFGQQVEQQPRQQERRQHVDLSE